MIVGKPLHNEGRTPADITATVVTRRGAEQIEESPQVRFDLALLDLSPRSRPRTVAERWAFLVLQTIHADHDPKTVTTWAKWVGVSRSGLSEYCRLVHIPAHDARDFARLLRAIVRSADRWQPEAVLDVADYRTLNRLLMRGGLMMCERRVPTVWDFLERQRLVLPSNPGLLALRRSLLRRD